MAETLARLADLGRAPSPDAPVVSVYLNTRWSDEHQRDRTRVFLKNEVRRARALATTEALRADLAWVEEQGERLVAQAEHPDAHGVALFACGARGVREVLPVRVPFEDAFLVDARPLLTPLAALLEEAPPTLVVFVDGERARLIPVDAEGLGEEVTLEHEVVGRHRRGGWALLAQSRYQRHIEVHRDQHFEAVAAALGQLVDEIGIERIVLAGEPRTLAVFRRRLPPALAARIVGSVAGTRWEPARALVARAVELVAHLDASAEMKDVDSVLVEAAKGGRAIAGVTGTLDAVRRGAVHRLYVLRAFDPPGRECPGCGALYANGTDACPMCGATTRPVRLGAVVVDRVVAAGGTVEVIDTHAELERAGGIAARLRYPV
jgi:peptide subunit release factor 1 (eRF1)